MEEFHFVSITPVTKGWSEDKKYCVVREDGSKNLLRISPAEQYERKKTEFRMMEQVQELGVSMCLPLEFGTCEEGVYSLQSWIEGRDAEELIPSLPKKDQYKYGTESGEMLRLIHSIPAPAGQEDWAARFNRKADRKIEMYRNCPIKFKGAEKMIRYLEENRPLLEGRPQSFQHGDYHVGNMMVDLSGRLVVIDFNRSDFGDPWEEFNRIVWDAQASPRFASGLVDGYFGGKVPLTFWRLLALYISSNTLSSVPWAIPFGQGEVDTMLRQAEEVLGWYDGMDRVVPSWYEV